MVQTHYTGRVMFVRANNKESLWRRIRTMLAIPGMNHAADRGTAFVLTGMILLVFTTVDWLRSRWQKRR